MKSQQFWTFFNTEAYPHLGIRAQTFRKIFEYLDSLNRQVGIIETGCVRDLNKRGTDGNSTVLFSKYAEINPLSVVYSVDIDPENVKFCQLVVNSNQVNVHNGDSVPYLKLFAERTPTNFPRLDLLYLDSFDLDRDNIFPSAFHHFKELLAISPLIRSETLVVVDDSPLDFFGFIENEGVQVIGQPKISGKGKLIAEYAEQIKATKLFSAYQSGWTNLRN